MAALAFRMLGFTVEDLGVNVPPETFLEAARQFKPDIVGMSGLLVVAFDAMQQTITLLREHATNCPRPPLRHRRGHHERAGGALRGRRPVDRRRHGRCPAVPGGPRGEASSHGTRRHALDALLPPEMAIKAEQTGIKKAGMGVVETFVLAILAGAFVALGAMFATTVTAGAAGLPYGITRLLAGLAFSLGLILVVVAGAELFTGNNLIVMAWAGRKISTLRLLRNWVLVWVGNLVGLPGDGGAHAGHRAVQVRRRRGRGDGPLDRQHQGRAGLPAGPRSWASCATPWSVWRSG